MIGSQVSRFRVLSRIGHGGMGEVYLARDISLDRQVALKFVTGADSTDPEAARRLLREAHAIAALDHPFICKVYEAGDSDGRH
jgi:eukaryotic-like serine/threonine-protein kinase